MDIKYNNVSFLNEENTINFSRVIDDKHFYLNIWFFSDNFKEYQKNLFSDFFSKIIEINNNNELFIDFKKELESTIKDFNLKLKIFQEKINEEWKIEIRGNLQIIYNNTYLAGLIWESSIIIFRDWKLETVIPNEVEEDDKIDIFSEIIEWELENWDKIIGIWNNIYNYLQNNEIKELIETWDILDSLKDILITRIEEKEICFLEELDISIQKIKITEESFEPIVRIKEKIEKYKYPIWIVIWLSIIFFIIISIFLYLWKNNNEVIQIWNSKITTNLDSLKRRIDAFSKLENTNTKSAKQEYHDIISKLDLYEKNNIQVLKIKELRKKMEQNYYKWFHINIVWENDWILNIVYKINKNTLNELSWTKQIIKTNNYLNIVWNKWVVLWIIDKKTKWIIKKIDLPTTIETCSKNLSKNWVYCYMKNKNIVNFSKYWVSSLTNNSKTWWDNILNLWIYWSNKLYTLSLNKELNNKNIYISRYVLKNRNKFWNVNNYVFSKKVDKKLLSWIFTWSSMTIDGSFLIWSKNGLLQAYRKNIYDKYLSLRVVKWWDKWIIDPNKDFKWKVKVISNSFSKYVYLYDYNTQSLVVYLTSPYKTNDKYFTEYNLIYKFKVKFSITNEKVKDITMKESSSTWKAKIYILTENNIYSLDLSEFNN